MESKRFDELSKAVASMSSRRHVVKGIAAGVVASAAGIFGRGATDAAARKRRFDEICRKPGDCEEGLLCTPAGHGRDRCCTAEGNVCGGHCCQTVCFDGVHCADGFVDVNCYRSCVDARCPGFNQGVQFNGTLQECEFFCAQQCSQS